MLAVVGTEGKHFIIEGIYKGDEAHLRDRYFMKNLFEDVLNKTKVTIFGFVDKDFNGEGVSGVFLLGESHFSYHTWPNEKYVSMDFYVCGTKFLQNVFLNEIYRYFFVGDMLILNRGLKTGKVFRIRKDIFY